MSLVKIEASFDPSNVDQLTAVMAFLAAVGGNVVPTSAPSSPQAEPEKPAPKKRAPRKKKVEETPKEETKTETAPAAEKTETAEITLEDIRTLTSQKAKDHREAIKAKLTEWGAANVVKIPAEKYPEFVEFLNGL